METFVEDAKYQNFAIRKAEQRKLNSLKNMNLPWVFVEPTRLKSVKIPKSRKPLNYYEGLDDEDLEFLGNSKIPFTKDDIQILQQSLHGENKSATDHDQILYDNFDESQKLQEDQSINSSRQNYNNLEHKDTAKPDQDLNLNTIDEEDSEELVSSRSNGKAVDDLFASDDDKPKKIQEEEDKIEIEAETVKNIIMDAVKEREEASKLKKKKIESNHPLSFFSYKTDKTNRTVAKEKLTLGRRKLLSAISSSSPLKHEEDSLTYARNKFEKENNLKRAALEKCFGTKHFKDYLERQNAEIPQLLLNIT